MTIMLAILLGIVLFVAIDSHTLSARSVAADSQTITKVVIDLSRRPDEWP